MRYSVMALPMPVPVEALFALGGYEKRVRFYLHAVAVQVRDPGVILASNNRFQVQVQLLSTRRQIAWFSGKSAAQTVRREAFCATAAAHPSVYDNAG